MYSVCIYTLLKVVGYYELSVLSMSVMGFQKKKFGWGEVYPIFLGFLELFNFAKLLNRNVINVKRVYLGVSLHFSELGLEVDHLNGRQVRLGCTGRCLLAS